MVELVFKAMHGERFQSCETKIFKNSDGRIKFLLKFPMRNCFKVLSMQPRMTGLLTLWFARIDFDFAKNSDSDQMGL